MKADNWLLKRILQGAVYLAVLGLIAFGVAGRLDWFGAWAYLLLTLVYLPFGMGWAGSKELIDERARAPADAKGWDRLLMRVVTWPYLIMLIVAGLDYGRLHWSAPLPFGVQVGGLVAFAVAILLTSWAMKSNPFFSKVVRIQRDRGQSVASGGPYGYVRHPGYVGGILMALGEALLLGSVWGLPLAALSIGATLIRTALEDRTLLAELPGYVEYAARVRYRLLPGVW